MPKTVFLNKIIPIMPADLKKILIIKPSSLGDIALTLPALSALRRSFPHAKISWLIRPEFSALLENHPHLDRTIFFDRKFFGKAWYNPRAFLSLLSFVRQLRSDNFNAVIDLQGLFRTACLAWLSGCKKRFGMATAREFAHIFYTHKVPQNQSCIHVVDYYLKIAKTAGAHDTAVEFVLPCDAAASDSIRKLLTSHNIEIDNYAVLVPGSARAYKCWPIERFAALADKISSQFGLSIIAVGIAPEKELVEKLKSLAKVPITNFAGLTSLPELIALLKTARLVVSNDTGPGHIAAALGTPLVMIFGCSNPARIYPYGRNNCVVAVEPDSRGLEIRSNNPKYDIKAITPEDVYRKVCEQLKQTPA